ncbi:ubiquitin domain-containing protein [Poronia punctata]|nr:ubiquitin domain-containing protein [Poronia punctata]
MSIVSSGSAVSSSPRAANAPPSPTRLPGHERGTHTVTISGPNPHSPAVTRHRRRHLPLSQIIDKPLRRHEWVSEDHIWTRADLDRKRTEFFDTRVEGRQEIWQAIRAALEILWEVDKQKAAGSEVTHMDDTEGIATAQSLLKAAGITLPSGDLSSGAYDFAGNEYVMPDWVVSDPNNMAEEPGRQTEIEAHAKGDEHTTGESTPNPPSEVEGNEGEGSRRRRERGKGGFHNRVKVRARMSDNLPDVVVRIEADESVASVAKKIAEKIALPASRKIRVFYLGKFLQESISLQKQGWKKGDAVNAYIFDRL